MLSTMSKIPERVEKAFRALKQEYEHIYLKQLKANYYVYKQTYEWQQDRKISKTVSEYIGKITSEGVFVKRLVSYKDEFEKAKAIIAAHGGEITWHKGKEEPAKGLPELEKSEINVKDRDLKLLMALSMNARMPISKLAKLAGLSGQAAYSRIRTLEARLGIKYLLEVDLEKLGYTPYLLIVKFNDEAPSAEEIRNAFMSEPRVQLSVMIKGTYELIAYILDKNYTTAADNFRSLIIKTGLARYKAQWNLMPFGQVYSFVPLRENFIETMLETRKRGKQPGNTSVREDKLLRMEFIVLKELNANSIQSFSEIDKKYNLNKGTARYAYSRLKAREVIIRPTISLTNLPLKYIGIIQIMDIDEKAVGENRYKSLLDLIKYGNIVNKYCLSGNIGMPDGAIRFLPIFNDLDIDKIAKNIEKELRGCAVRSFVVTNLMVGSLCYRRFDNDYSRQQRILVELGKTEIKKPINYEITSTN